MRRDRAGRESRMGRAVWGAVLATAAATAAAPPARAAQGSASPCGVHYAVLYLDAPVPSGGFLTGTLHGKPMQPYIVLFGTDFGATPLPGFPPAKFSCVDLTKTFWPMDVGTIPASGTVPYSIFVPDNPIFYGTTYHFQGFINDYTAPSGLAITNEVTRTFLGPSTAPSMDLVTANAIPEDQSGANPNEGTLLVPPTGFTIDLFFSDPFGAGIDPASLLVTADQALGGGAIPAGTNLAPFFTVTPAAGTATALVDPSWTFPAATVTVTAQIASPAGTPSNTASFTFQSGPWPPKKMPFATTQDWWIAFDKDSDQDGVPDFNDDLTLFGLAGGGNILLGPSWNVAQEVIRRIRFWTEVYYAIRNPDGTPAAGAPNLRFWTEKPTTSPFSKICVGGRNSFSTGLPPGATETTGAAFFDPNNQNKTEVLCSSQLGVHTRSIFNIFQIGPTFQATFGPLQATPVGTHPMDVLVTDPAFEPSGPGPFPPGALARWAVIDAGMEALARATAFIVAQETGHSIGLVSSGKLPKSLLGGGMFGHSTGGHFDDGLGNIMSGNNSTPSPGNPSFPFAIENTDMIWNRLTSGGGHFTPLNLAYLRQRIIEK